MPREPRPDAHTLRTDLARAARDPNGIRHAAVWTETPDCVQALTDEKKRILEAMKPRNVHAAGWEE